MPGTTRDRRALCPVSRIRPVRSVEPDAEDRDPDTEQPHTPLTETVVPHGVQVVSPVIDGVWQRSAVPVHGRRWTPAPRWRSLAVVPLVVAVVGPPWSLVRTVAGIVPTGASWPSGPVVPAGAARPAGSRAVMPTGATGALVPTGAARATVPRTTRPTRSTVSWTTRPTGFTRPAVTERETPTVAGFQRDRRRRTCRCDGRTERRGTEAERTDGQCRGHEPRRRRFHNHHQLS